LRTSRREPKVRVVAIAALLIRMHISIGTAAE